MYIWCPQISVIHEEILQRLVQDLDILLHLWKESESFDEFNRN